MKKVSAAVKKFTAKRKAKKAAKKRKKARDKRAKQLRDERKKKRADKDGKKRDDPNKKKQDKEKAKQDKLDRAVEKVRPKVEALLQRGVSKLSLKGRLFLLGATHGLSSLKLQGKAVEARVNPKKVVAEAQELQLAAELERIVQWAEFTFLSMYEKARAKESTGEALGPRDPKRSQAVDELREFHDIKFGRTQVSGANARFVTPQRRAMFRSDHEMGGSSGQGVFANVYPTRKEKAEAWAARKAGLDVPVPEDLLSRTTLSGMEVRNLGPYNENFAQGAVFSEGLDLSPQARTLASLEGARSAGAFTTNEINMAVARQSGASPQEAAQSVFVDKGPMGMKDSSTVAHKEQVEGTEFREGGRNKQVSDARKKRILESFKAIRASIKSEKGLVGKDRALARVASAFENWMQARTKEGAAADGDEVIARAKQLVVALIVFLKRV